MNSLKAQLIVLSTQKMPKICIGAFVLVITGILDLRFRFFSGNFLGMLYLSILCTAGLGLIIWTPLSYLIGTIILLPIRYLSPDKRLTNLTDETFVLKKYITAARIYGMSDSEIRDRLLDSSWKESQFNELLNETNHLVAPIHT